MKNFKPRIKARLRKGKIDIKKKNFPQLVKKQRL